MSQNIKNIKLENTITTKKNHFEAFDNTTTLQISNIKNLQSRLLSKVGSVYYFADKKNIPQ